MYVDMRTRARVHVPEAVDDMIDGKPRQQLPRAHGASGASISPRVTIARRITAKTSFLEVGVLGADLAIADDSHFRQRRRQRARERIGSVFSPRSTFAVIAPARKPTFLTSRESGRATLRAASACPFSSLRTGLARSRALSFPVAALRSARSVRHVPRRQRCP
jgi:hypothetical protein